VSGCRSIGPSASGRTHVSPCGQDSTRTARPGLRLGRHFAMGLAKRYSQGRSGSFFKRLKPTQRRIRVCRRVHRTVSRSPDRNDFGSPAELGSITPGSRSPMARH
jgi:hypothetical protein